MGTSNYFTFEISNRPAPKTIASKSPHDPFGVRGRLALAAPVSQPDVL